VIWPLYWGVAAIASLVFLFFQPATRRTMILFGLPLLAELGITLIATNGLETRYLFYWHPTFWVLIWLGLGAAYQRLRKPSSV
jgi:hypothetical protein